MATQLTSTAELLAMEDVIFPTAQRGIESAEAHERRLVEQTAAELATCEQWRALLRSLLDSGRITFDLWQAAVNTWACIETACDGEPRTWAIDELPSVQKLKARVAQPTREEAL